MEKGKSRKLLSMVIDKFESRPFFKQVAGGVPLIPFKARPKMPVVFINLEDGRMEDLTNHEKTKFLPFSITGIYEEQKHPELVGCDVQEEIEDAMEELRLSAEAQGEAVSLKTFNFRVGPTIEYGTSNLIRVDPPLYALAIDGEFEFDYDTTA